MAPPRPENPLTKLARLLGGVVLMRGPLGHQVLGQLLVSDLRESELAGASVVLAAGSRRKSTLARAAIGTAAPAFALERYYGKVGAQMARRQAAVEERERQARERGEVAPGPDVAALYREIGSLRAELDALHREKLALEQRLADATITAPLTVVEAPSVVETPCAPEAPSMAAPRPSEPSKPSKPSPSTPSPSKPTGRKRKGGR